MTQILFVHGGTTYARYEDYLHDLSTKEIHVDRLAFKPMWRERLQESLDTEYTVLMPSMPNKTNARYKEWKLYFDNLTSILEDDCILIGHSLGAIFLAKYLSENKLARHVKATILVAAPFEDESTEDLTDFKLETVTELFKQQAGKVIFYFGSDDPVIALSEMEKYQAELPNAEYNVLSAPDHFMRPDFPEILETIKNI
jgi:predicted alpha/beta hydrolase family esterase